MGASVNIVRSVSNASSWCFVQSTVLPVPSFAFVYCKRTPLRRHLVSGFAVCEKFLQNRL